LISSYDGIIHRQPLHFKTEFAYCDPGVARAQAGIENFVEVAMWILFGVICPLAVLVLTVLNIFRYGEWKWPIIIGCLLIATTSLTMLLFGDKIYGKKEDDKK